MLGGLSALSLKGLFLFLFVLIFVKCFVIWVVCFEKRKQKEKGKKKIYQTNYNFWDGSWRCLQHYNTKSDEDILSYKMFHPINIRGYICFLRNIRGYISSLCNSIVSLIKQLYKKEGYNDQAPNKKFPLIFLYVGFWSKTKACFSLTMLLTWANHKKYFTFNTKNKKHPSKHINKETCFFLLK